MAMFSRRARRSGEHARYLRGATFLFLCAFNFASAQVAGTALVRHAPSVNGTVEGSLQQMLPESTTFNGGATVTQDLLVPGTPTILLNGSPTYA